LEVLVNQFKKQIDEGNKKETDKMNNLKSGSHDENEIDGQEEETKNRK